MSQKIKVLLAEDDQNLGTILKSYLEAKGFPTILCVNGKEAWEAFNHQEFNFCIVDVMMPLKDGFSLTQDIRRINREIPILFLTAKSMQQDILKGFSVGADDYLTKPFSMDELLARIQAILRRIELSSTGISRMNDVFEIGRLKLNFPRQILETPEGEVKLTSKEALLLKMLCEKPNAVLERTEALKTIWQDDSYFNARSMDVYITKIRKYLKADPNVNIVNVHGVGFKLVVY
ncbi:MAG: response regulator transcription factor [Bacteroidales bacterium]